MKTKNFLLIAILMSFNFSFGQIQEICTDFNNNSEQDWATILCTTSIVNGGRDGTKYLEVLDGDGESWIQNQITYPSNLSKCDNINLCYDFKLIRDDDPNGIVPKNPSITIFFGPSPTNSIYRADFIAAQNVTENDDWVQICAPIRAISGTILPSNSQGTWNMFNGTSANWNTLIANISGVAIKVEVSGPVKDVEIIGVDNICLKDCSILTTNEGAYCCEGENLVENGNFEAGDQDFASSYTSDVNVNPGYYDVTTNASAFNATITDHSFCENPVLYAGNDMYMVVNGKTQQQSSNVWVWAQEITGLEPEMKYKFCANFKNMPQCTFDILPSITMIGANSFIANQIINTDPNDPCEWQNVEMTFTATSSSHTVAIYLDETGNGDGNDVAIDDISVTELIDPNLSITVQHQGNPQVITASINTISTTDDVLHGADCEYYWFTAEVLSYPPIVINGSTFAYGNDSGNSVGPSPWDLTTTFPDYTFNQNTLYIIGMYTPECECYDEGFTYQLTYNNLTNVPEMTEAQKEQIIYWILHGYNGPLGTSTDLERNSEELKVYPNPAKDGFTASMLNDTIKSIQIVSISGQTVFTKQLAQGKMEETIDVSTLASGMYFVKVTGENQKQYTAKLLKE